MNTTPPETEKLLWVRDEGGQPRVRWERVAAFLLALVGVNLVSGAAVSYLADTPFLGSLAIAPAVCGMLAYLIVAIELQRQRVLTGQWRFRLGLSTCLLLMLVAGIFSAVVGNGIRANQRGHATNLQLKAELEEALRGGTASIGRVNGQRITCHINQPDFTDAELTQVIKLASHQGSGPCELSGLFFDECLITDAGVQQLASCSDLRILSLPSLPLSDEAIAAIGRCKRLEMLLLDEKQLTAEQLAALQRALPRVKLNGQTWKARGM